MFNRDIDASENGVTVGHWTDADAKTGVTVVVFDRPAPAIVDVRGGAPGTRETDLLGSGMLVQSVDAVVFSGGSAFGLASADGVMTELRALGRGVATPAGHVPIVPAAVIYDLAVGKPISPAAEHGASAVRDRASLKSAAWGQVGAGTGATTGKIGGGGERGGIGYGYVDLSHGHGVHAIVVVNAAGVVVDPETGRGVIESTPTDRASLLNRLTALHDRAATTLGVVIVDAPSDRRTLERCGVAAHDGYARAIRPCHTLFDGDVVFAASMRPGTPTGAEIVRLALAAELAVERAIVAAVRAT